MLLSAGMQKVPKKLRLGTAKKQWVVASADSRSDSLAKSLKISPLLAQILINRGITDPQTARVFLNPKLTELIPPEEMPNAASAADRIKQAVDNKEKITVYGDYDVDGITGVSILWQLLTLLGAEVDFYIPHRIDEGYGLNADAIKSLAQADTKLLITVDCGINAVNSALLAKELGLDLIITDHHQPAEKLPNALAIVHPALDKSYQNQNSSGSMVAFKLAWAIANKFNSGRKLDAPLREFMLNATSLAAMGTIADIMDLRGENRVLTSFGLKALPQCNLCGIQALIESARLTGQGLDSYHIGFRLAPMLNAAGRMGHARLAVELLTSNSQIRSTQIADYLKGQNEQRRKYERKIFKQAYEIVISQNLNHPDQKSIVLANQNWHTGVIGIVASRLIDKFYRPVIMLNTTASESDKIAQGSARSIQGFDILAAISACSQHLIDFGGHKAAAGLKIETEKIPQFTDAFENYAKQNLNDEDCITKINIDAIAPLGWFTKKLTTELQMLKPFGQGNPKPTFATKSVRLCSTPRTCGAKNDHLQLVVTDQLNSVRCIGFGFGKLEKKLLEHEFFNIAYQPQINNYNGNSNVEFLLNDIQFD